MAAVPPREDTCKCCNNNKPPPRSPPRNNNSKNKMKWNSRSGKQNFIDCETKLRERENAGENLILFVSERYNQRGGIFN